MNDNGLPEDVIADLAVIQEVAGDDERLGGILTTLDPLAQDERLIVPGVTEGFERRLLPFTSGHESTSILHLEAGIRTGFHAHPSHTMHTVIEGAIRINTPNPGNGPWLRPGDSVSIPSNTTYELEVGPAPAVVQYVHW